MARLHEYQGKFILREFNIPTPPGGPARSPEEARKLAQEIGTSVVIKSQVWITGRASLGAIRFAEIPAEAEKVAADLLGKQVKGFAVDTVLVEKKLDIEREFYAGVIIDDKAKAPVIIFSTKGGSGIEQIAQEHPEAVRQLTIDIQRGLAEHEARNLVRHVGIHGDLQSAFGSLLSQLYRCARQYDARSAEINPLVLTTDGQLVAADCRLTIDDYAVYRHPQLKIDVAREFDRPPTELERIAWEVEKNDYRGTFYFIQMEQQFQRGDGVIGFHGAGGGGSMMSMDALMARNYRLANYVDTSGNPPASKVYRAARIILAQKGLDGYFASGSGVASQEQFHSARGLVKAFMEVPLMVPAVIRLGGNAEERAIAILERAREYIPAPLEAYGKDDTPDFCAERLHALIQDFEAPPEQPTGWRYPDPIEPYPFDTVTGGQVILDHSVCRDCEKKVCVEACVPKILILQDNVPILKISPQEASKGGCTECLACEVECFFEGNRGGRVILPIAGLEHYSQEDRGHAV
jgi:succinyl-CoA synthetase beta subunit